MQVFATGRFLVISIGSLRSNDFILRTMCYKKALVLLPGMVQRIPGVLRPFSSFNTLNVATNLFSK